MPDNLGLKVDDIVQGVGKLQPVMQVLHESKFKKVEDNNDTACTSNKQ